MLTLAGDRVEVEQIHYGWGFLVSSQAQADGGGNESASEEGVAGVEQDAVTGELTHVNVGPADIADPPRGNSAWEAIPGPGFLALLPLAAAALLPGRRRSS